MVHHILSFCITHTSFATPVIRLNYHIHFMWQPLKSSQNTSLITRYMLVVHFLSLGCQQSYYPIGRLPTHNYRGKLTKAAVCFAFSSSPTHSNLHRQHDSTTVSALPYIANHPCYSSVATGNNTKLFHQDLPTEEAVKSHISPCMQTRNLHSLLTSGLCIIVVKVTYTPCLSLHKHIG